MNLRTALFAGMAMAAVQSPAADLIRDHFSDGSFGAGSVGADIDRPWYAHNSSAGGASWSIRTDNTAPLSGSAMGHASPGSAENTRMITGFPLARLARAGDRIEVALDARSTNGTASAGGLILSLGYDNGTPMVSNELGSFPTTADDILVSFVTLANTSHFTTTVPRSLVFRLELAGDEISLLRSVTVDGVVVVNDTIAAPATFLFNQLRVFWNQAAPNVDNVRVTTNALGGELAVIDGSPQAWMVVGPWPGKAGLAITGANAEKYLHPNPGDYTPIMRPLDHSPLELHWTEAPSSAGVTTIGTTGQSYSWPGGAAYAALYVHSASAQTVWLQTVQSGTKTLAWLNGNPVALAKDTVVPTAFASLNSVSVEKGQQAALMLNAGWNRLLLKYVMAHGSGEVFSFATRFSDASLNPATGLRCQMWDPTLDQADEALLALHAEANRLILKVNTNAPSNLPRPGDALTLTIDSQALVPHGSGAVSSFAGNYRVRIHDSAGALVDAKDFSATVPGASAVSLGSAPAMGYYTVEVELWSADWAHRLAAFPPDGFSVIGGATSQASRKAAKKMSYTYYFMQNPAAPDMGYAEVFPWMQRIGVYRTVGSDQNNYTSALWSAAQTAGITPTADYWDAWHNKSAASKQTYAAQAGAHTPYFKGFNEIDIQSTSGVPGVPQRPTPAAWAAQAAIEYGKAHLARADAVYIGGSFAFSRSDSVSWLEACLDAGLYDYQDAWDVHDYPKNPPALEGSFAGGAEAVGAALAGRGLANTKPYWIGECAARASHGLDGRIWQADTLAKMVACAISHDTTPVWQVISFLIPSHYDPRTVGDIAMGHMPGEAAFYTAGALIDGFAYSRIQPATVAINNTTPHSLTMRLTRTGAGLQISYAMDGVALPGTLDTTPATYAFDMINLSSNANAALRVDNIKVRTSTQTLLDDRFLDGSLANGSDPGETDVQWYFLNSSSGGTAWTRTTDNTAPLSGSVLNNPTGSAANTMAIAQFATATLVASGDWVEFSCDFRYNSVPNSGTVSFLIGNSEGTPFTANVFGGSSPRSDDTGHGFSQNVGSASFTFTELNQGSLSGGGSGIQAAAFDKTRMLWAPGGGPLLYNLSIAGADQAVTAWVVVDVVGRVTAVSAVGSGASAVVPLILTGSPVYVLPQSVYTTLTQ